MANDPTARVVTLALAASPEPLSIDTLVAWDLVRPSELWATLSAAQARGEVVQPAAGRFALATPGAAEAAVAGASPEEWAALLGDAGRIGWACAAARAAAAARRVALANELWSAVATAASRERFPGGDAGWLAAVLEGLRYNRAMYGVPPSRYAEALAAAAALGDVGAQGVLHGTLALAHLRDGLLPAAREHLDAARDAARACAGAVRAEIHVYLAIGLAFQGRLRQAIDAFEELLGDVPEDLGALVSAGSASPATTLLVLSTAYTNVGEGPRALDLVHRLRRLGAERGHPVIEREADLFTAVAHLARDEHDAARAYAERAHAFYAGGDGADPLHRWFAGATLAAIRQREGRTADAVRLLADALAARAVAGWWWLPGTALLDLFEELEVSGAAVPGLDLGAELDRLVAGSSLLWRGVGHRYRARRLARLPGGEGSAVREELDRAAALLREAGAAPELSRTLDDAAALARGAGRAGDLARIAEARREAAARAPLAACASPGPDRRARLAGILVELGRLGALSPRREGTWGELAARLCGALAAERCALFQAGAAPRLLGARGGGAPWRDALQALLAARAPRAVEALPGPDVPGDDRPGRLLVVPFAAEGRAGWACLESRHGEPAVGPEDGELLEVLSAQLGVLLANVALWQELTAARERLEEENRYWRSSAPATAPGSRLVGDSPALREVLALVARVAPGTTPVLVTGETGVGKELVASEIHRQGPRRAGPFIAVHVASLSPGLVASGLFGHERGAFTGATERTKGRFELADGGTLFLDEVGELAPEDQVRLLRVLQEGTFERVGGARPIRSDFRLVAATHRDLEAEVRAGRFREDLYYRLAGFPIRVPPLRERREEIPTLALFFMERASRARGVRFDGIGEADVRRLLEYPWPGNVRELEHLVERAVLLSEPPRLRIPPLEARTRTDLPGRGAPPAGPAATDLLPLEEVERRHVAAVLHRTRGRITGAGGAAEILGLNPSTLHFRIRKLGLLEEVQRARAVTRA